MKVKILRPSYDSRMGSLKPGMVVEVTDYTAQRWIARKIASEVIDNGRKAEQGNAEGYAVEEEQGSQQESIAEAEPAKKPGVASNYATMTKAELLNEGYRKGIHVHAGLTKVEILERLLGG